MNEVRGHVDRGGLVEGGRQLEGGRAWTEREGNEVWYSLGIPHRHYRLDAVLPWPADWITDQGSEGVWGESSGQ